MMTKEEFLQALNDVFKDKEILDTIEFRKDIVNQITSIKFLEGREYLINTYKPKGSIKFLLQLFYSYDRLVYRLDIAVFDDQLKIVEFEADI